MNIFELLRPRYQLPERPRIFESFSGIGCQRLAFKRLSVNVESVGISEIDKYAVSSYIAIHGETRNFGDITKIKGFELPQIDVFTYSFPCTDLSKAGRQKGLNSTRSGLVYEVLRILHECSESGNLPRVLIMENVVDLVQVKFIREFQEIQVELEKLGYSNYTDTLNAKDYGVAQNRDRVFMVSILGEFYYEFPRSFPLKKRLKDYLEPVVDEKYYLSKAMLDYCMDPTDRNGFVRGDRFNPQNPEDADYAFAVTTNPGSRPVDNFIKEPFYSKLMNVNPSGKGMNGNVFVGDMSPTITTNKGEGMKFLEPVCINSKVDGKQPSVQDRIYDSSGISTAITTSFMPSVTVKEATEKGFAQAYEGDCINMSQPKSKTRRGRVGQQMAQTITTQNELGVVINEPSGLYLGTSEKFKRGPLEGLSRCLKAQNHDSGVSNGLRIRKLTPLECWRLMGIDDEDFWKAKSVCSNAQLYKQAGNGIVVDVFAAIIKQMIVSRD